MMTHGIGPSIEDNGPIQLQSDKKALVSSGPMTMRNKIKIRSHACEVTGRRPRAGTQFRDENQVSYFTGGTS